MRFAIGGVPEPTTDLLAFARQIGASGIVLNKPDPAGHWILDAARPGSAPGREPMAARSTRWDFLDLLQMRQMVEETGLRIEAIENTPFWFYDKIMLGLPGAEDQIENYKACIRAMGQAGIRVLGYHWMPNRVWRTSKTLPTRGGAETSGFEKALADLAPATFDREYSKDDLWATYAEFIREVLPVAEESGVTLALHPDDPGVPSLGGVARIFCDIAGFDRALELGDSPNHGLNFCVGTWAEHGNKTLLEALRHFGGEKRIVYGHLRNISGTLPQFNETFVDEGDLDLLAILREFRQIDFDGFFIEDHVPRMSSDTDWGHRSRAFAAGYIRGLLRAVA